MNSPEDADPDLKMHIIFGRPISDKIINDLPPQSLHIWKTREGSKLFLKRASPSKPLGFESTFAFTAPLLETDRWRVAASGSLQGARVAAAPGTEEAALCS